MEKQLKLLCNLAYTVVVVAAVVFLVPPLLQYFMPFVIGFVFSLIAGPIVRFLEKHINIRRKFGSVLMVSLTIALIAAACSGIARILFIGIEELWGALPAFIESAQLDLTHALQQFEIWFNALPFEDLDLSELETQISGLLTGLANEAPSALLGLGRVVKNVPDLIVNAVVCLMAAYFFTASKEEILSWLQSKLSPDFKKYMEMLYRQTIGAVVGYFKAQFRIMFVVYIALFIGLLLLRIPYAWLLGLGIAFLDMLPIFGTGTVLLPWAVVQLFAGEFQQALGMLLLYGVTFLIHQLVQPKLLGDSMGMDPFAALFFMYIGYRANSVLGMIVSIPVGMVLLNLVKAGAFDTQIYCVKELLRSFHEFRKIDRPKDQRKE